MAWTLIQAKIQKGILSAFVAYSLLFTGLLRDRGKLDANHTDEESPADHHSINAQPLQRFSPDFVQLCKTANEKLSLHRDREWRFGLSPPPNRFKRSLLADREKFSNRELNCEDVREKLANVTPVGAGWTKAVFRADHGQLGPVAVKIVNVQGRHIQNCIQSPNASFDICYGEAVDKLLKEIVLLRHLQHSNMIKILGYCIPQQPYKAEGGDSVAVITELGEPVDIIKLLQLNFEERLWVLHSLAKLLHFLDDQSRFASIALNDFRTQQFVTVDGVLKIVDADDFVVDEPRCEQAVDCNVDDTSVVIECRHSVCVGTNAKRNLAKAHRLFYKNLLPYGAPSSISNRIEELLIELEAGDISAAELLKTMDHFAEAYSTVAVHPFSSHFHPNVGEYHLEPYSDMPGVGDYMCSGSRNQVGCSLSVSGLAEAQHLCTAHSACRAFVWTNQRSWTGRNIVHFKNNISTPTYNEFTHLYIRRSK